MNIPPQVVQGDGDRYFSGKASNGTHIYIGPVTQDQLKDAGVGGTATGYYLCEFDATDPAAGVHILASFTSPEAAYHLAQVLGLFDMDCPLAAFEEALDIGN